MQVAGAFAFRGSGVRVDTYECVKPLALYFFRDVSYKRKVPTIMWTFAIIEKPRTSPRRFTLAPKVPGVCWIPKNIIIAIIVHNFFVIVSGQIWDMLSKVILLKKIFGVNRTTIIWVYDFSTNDKIQMSLRSCA
jgi:hypothetical protein